MAEKKVDIILASDSHCYVREVSKKDLAKDKKIELTMSVQNNTFSNWYKISDPVKGEHELLGFMIQGLKINSLYLIEISIGCGTSTVASVLCQTRNFQGVVSLQPTLRLHSHEGFYIRMKSDSNGPAEVYEISKVAVRQFLTEDCGGPLLSAIETVKLTGDEINLLPDTFETKNRHGCWVAFNDGYGVVGYAFHCPKCHHTNKFFKNYPLVEDEEFNGVSIEKVQCENCKKEFKTIDGDDWYDWGELDE